MNFSPGLFSYKKQENHPGKLSAQRLIGGILGSIFDRLTGLLYIFSRTLYGVAAGNEYAQQEHCYEYYC